MRKFIFISATIGVAIAIGFGVFIFERPEIFFGKHDFIKPPMPIGVMIENEIMARPFQQGLSQADIVYEAPTEGDITRFLALFVKSEYSGKIGPVRSARPYFLDWMSEYGGLYAHVGGSDEAINRLWKSARAENNGTTSSGIFNVDQFFYEKYFWRENVGKTALEHTMFTTLEILQNLIVEMNWEYQSAGIPFESTQKIDVDNFPSAPEINIDFGIYSSRVKYIYYQDQDRYLRYQNGKTHIDYAVNKQISAGMVVVQRVQSWSLNDDKFRIGIKTVGEGEAVIFVRGKIVKAKWQKKSIESKTQFFDKNGDEINLTERPVWIEIVPEQNKVGFN